MTSIRATHNTGTDRHVVIERSVYTPDGAAAFIGVGKPYGRQYGAHLSREATVRVIEELTDLVQAHDEAEEAKAREAEEAAKKAEEARAAARVARSGIKVGDTVRVVSSIYGTIREGHVGVAEANPGRGDFALRNPRGMRLGFFANELATVPTAYPDHELKAGDLVLISENPGTGPTPGAGYVSERMHGQVGKVRSAYPGARGVDVTLVGARPTITQTIHPAHLTVIGTAKEEQ